jgi:hypothetical protein
MLNYEPELEITHPSDTILILTISILCIINGLLGTGILAFFGFGLEILLYLGFVLLGLLLYSYHSDSQKAILGLIGMISSFYAGIFWSQSGYIIFPYSTIMTVISMAVLILSFATVCYVACTWPSYDYD